MWESKAVLSVAMLLATLVPGLPAPADAVPEPTNLDAPLARLAPTLAADAPLGVIVEVAGDPRQAASDAAARVPSLTPTHVYEHALRGFAANLFRGDLAALANLPYVTRVSHDRLAHATMDNARLDTQANVANDLGYTGKGVTVAVLDTGISNSHPALRDRIVGCVQFLLGLRIPVCEDDNGHGTHVAGYIASRDGTNRGIAPDASLVAVKVLNAAGTGTLGDIIAGMDYVLANRDGFDPPIRVLSASLGSDVSCGDNDGTSPDSRAAAALMQNGIVAVIAAGNAGPGACTVGTPGDIEDVITVGAVDDRGTPSFADDVIARFSSRGPTGHGIIKPDVVAPGVSITSTWLLNGWQTFDGTSMATPVVSGLIALLLEKEPGLTPQEVKARLTSEAVKLPADTGPTPNPDYGYGFVSACRTLQLADC